MSNETKGPQPPAEAQPVGVEALRDLRDRVIPAALRHHASGNGYIEEAQEIVNRALAQQPAAHPDDAAVDAFAAAMKEKLAAARAKGRSGWDGDEPGMQQRLSDMLRAHVGKGDPRDVANFAMFLHQRGEAILPVQQPAAVDDADAQAAEIERLRAEVATERGRREHTQQWYAVRNAKIEDVAKREGLWPEVAAIFANGSGTRQLPDGSYFYDPPTYAQQLNIAKHRATAAEARAERLVEALREKADKWDRIGDEHGVRQFTGNDHKLFANELRALLRDHDQEVGNG